MKFIVTLILGVFLTFGAMADDGSSGCGLGWQVAKQNSLISSFTRALINATFLSTLAMTSGTSGCAHHSIVMKEKESLHYAEANFSNLMVEMAEGRGEYLEGFAAVLGCNPNFQPAFSRMSQEKYQELFSNDTTPAGLLQNVKKQIHSNPELAVGCMNTTI